MPNFSRSVHFFMSFLSKIYPVSAPLAHCCCYRPSCFSLAGRCPDLLAPAACCCRRHCHRCHQRRHRPAAGPRPRANRRAPPTPRGGRACRRTCRTAASRPPPPPTPPPRPARQPRQPPSLSPSLLLELLLLQQPAWPHPKSSGWTPPAAPQISWRTAPNACRAGPPRPPPSERAPSPRPPAPPRTERHPGRCSWWASAPRATRWASAPPSAPPPTWPCGRRGACPGTPGSAPWPAAGARQTPCRGASSARHH